MAVEPEPTFDQATFPSRRPNMAEFLTQYKDAIASAGVLVAIIAAIIALVRWCWNRIVERIRHEMEGCERRMLMRSIDKKVEHISAKLDSRGNTDAA
jgi:hypothetical protein